MPLEFGLLTRGVEKKKPLEYKYGYQAIRLRRLLV